MLDSYNFTTIVSQLLKPTACVVYIAPHPNNIIPTWRERERGGEGARSERERGTGREGDQKEKEREPNGRWLKVCKTRS